jgi:hypothetical protein
MCALPTVIGSVLDARHIGLIAILNDGNGLGKAETDALLTVLVLDSLRLKASKGEIQLIPEVLEE